MDNADPGNHFYAVIHCDSMMTPFWILSEEVASPYEDGQPMIKV